MQHLEVLDRLEGRPLHQGFALLMDGGRLGRSPLDPLLWLTPPDAEKSLADMADDLLVQRLREEYGFKHPKDVAAPSAGTSEGPAGTSGDAAGTPEGTEAAQAGAREPGSETSAPAAAVNDEGVGVTEDGVEYIEEDPEGLEWVDGIWGADRIFGTYERYVRLMPTYPAFEVRLCTKGSLRLTGPVFPCPFVW